MDRQECTRLIEEFGAAWSARDVDALMELMAPECEFRASVGPEPGRSFVGREEVRDGFAAFLAPTDGPPPDTESLPLLVGPDFAVTRWIARVDGAPVVHGCDVFEFSLGRVRLKDTYRKVVA